ncbi:hypothetical protein [Delftia phage PhiW-14]|uniref:Uncharacterized protein n=1 Tax=Delftia phage PhiW-14 TaxID=665032 RepID=C9DGG6_BPW14|nr:hypothetical protein DP-phiW-14_gp196 [Delftia phage PhiW-14]ACV50217.1 hypothetical protein [Delftia phage PhiW-14]
MSKVEEIFHSLTNAELDKAISHWGRIRTYWREHINGINGVWRSRPEGAKETLWPQTPINMDNDARLPLEMSEMDTLVDITTYLFGGNDVYLELLEFTHKKGTPMWTPDQRRLARQLRHGGQGQGSGHQTVQRYKLERIRAYGVMLCGGGLELHLGQLQAV